MVRLNSPDIRPAAAGAKRRTAAHPTAQTAVPARWAKALWHTARQADGALLLVLLLCSFSLYPLLARPGLPNGSDVLYHVYRVAEMDRAWAHGLLTPRWAETFYTGYGAPLFHYYAGAAYWLTSILMRVFALDAVNSLRLLIALALFAGGAGTYLFARRYGGRTGGVLAALSYTYSPYILFTEPYARGAYPEMTALALFPWVLCAYGWLLDSGGRRALLLAALGSALLILTHNLMALVLTGLIAAWLGWSTLVQVVIALRAAGWRALVQLVLAQNTRHTALALWALALGVGLGSFFWLPVMLESDAVRLGNLTAVAQLDYRNFFVPLDALLAFTPRPDGGAINGLRLQLNLGVAQWVLALTGSSGLGVILLRRGDQALPGQTRQTALFFGLLGIVFIALMLPAAAFLWDALGALAFLQFPWRLLGPAAFCLALLAAFNGHWLERLPTRLSLPLLAGIVAALVALALPTLYVDEWEHTTVDTSPAAYHEQELAGRQRATTFSNEYLPAAVFVEPDATPRLLADYADGYPVDHAHQEILPPGVQVTLLNNAPQEHHWRVQAPTAFTLEVLIYDFAGWSAAIDGEPVPITPSDPHGLITLPVPAGEHTVTLVLGSTPARALGNIGTATAVILLIATLALLAREPAQAGTALLPAPPPIRVPDLLPAAHAGLLAGGAASLLLALLLLRPGGAWVESAPGTVQLAQHPVVFNFGDALQLLGYDLNGSVFHPGDTVQLTVYWYAPNGATHYGYASFVHLSQGGPPLAQADKLNPADRPTKEWDASGYLRDQYSIVLPADIPAGTYDLIVGLYTCDTLPAGQCGNGDRPPVTDAAGQPVGDAARLQTLEIR